MKIQVQKNHLGSQILYGSLDHSKKRGHSQYMIQDSTIVEIMLPRESLALPLISNNEKDLLEWYTWEEYTKGTWCAVYTYTRILSFSIGHFFSHT